MSTDNALLAEAFSSINLLACVGTEAFPERDILLHMGKVLESVDQKGDWHSSLRNLASTLDLIKAGESDMTLVLVLCIGRAFSIVMKRILRGQYKESESQVEEELDETDASASQPLFTAVVEESGRVIDMAEICSTSRDTFVKQEVEDSTYHALETMEDEEAELNGLDPFNDSTEDTMDFAGMQGDQVEDGERPGPSNAQFPKFSHSLCIDALNDGSDFFLKIYKRALDGTIPKVKASLGQAKEESEQIRRVKGAGNGLSDQRCGFCSFEFRLSDTWTNIYLHYWKDHAEKTGTLFKCRLCKKNLRFPGGHNKVCEGIVDFHYDATARIPTTDTFCSLCGTYFRAGTSKWAIEKHLRSRHGDIPGTFWKCFTCGITQRYFTPYEHVKTCTGEIVLQYTDVAGQDLVIREVPANQAKPKLKKIFCPFCKEEVKSPRGGIPLRSLSYHIKREHDSMPGTFFRCTGCSHRSRNSGVIESHISRNSCPGVTEFHYCSSAAKEIRGKKKKSFGQL